MNDVDFFRKKKAQPTLISTTLLKEKKWNGFFHEWKWQHMGK